MGLWVFDIDGTLDCAPRQFQAMMAALQAAGHGVYVITGTPNDPVTQQDWQEKANYLNSLGCNNYDVLVVLSASDKDTIADRKAQWLVANKADCLIDNDEANCQAASAAGIPCVITPWASRQ